jgi:uncharacterized protein (UPF0218 family)
MPAPRPPPKFERGVPLPEGVSLKLPDHLRSRLASPFGPVYPAEELPLHVRDATVVAAVGDVTAREATKRLGRVRFIVVDFKTLRGPVEDDAAVRSWGDQVRKVKSPAQILTASLWNAVLDAARSSKSTRIEVEGEEDLAVLPAIMHLAPGATVLYGMPDRGVTSVKVAEESVRLAREFLGDFEVIWK